MKTKRLLLFVVVGLIAVSILFSGCGLVTGGIPDPCVATGICHNPYTADNGWNNCPTGWQAVFEAGENSFVDNLSAGYAGYASYGVTTASGDPILGPDGQPEKIVPNLNDPSSLLPIAYCIKDGTQPNWPYIPANGECQPPAASYLQGSWSACPDQNQSHDCVCVPPGVPHEVPTPTDVPLNTQFFHDVASFYCVDPNKQLGAVVLSVPDTYNMTLTSGPSTLIKKQIHANGTSNFYTYIGPAGVSFEVEQCFIPPGGSPNSSQPDPNLCTQYKETYGTCSAGVKGGGGICQPPAAGCPSGTFWQGSPTCQCEGTK